MSIASYSDLKSLIARRLKRNDLTDYIPDYIRFAEARIYRELRVRQMETALSSAIASGVIAVPSGYLDLKHAYINGTPVQKLQRKDAEWIYQNYPTRSSDSQPKFIAREGESFIFGPYPDSAYTVKGIYYKKLDALSDSNTSNWLITDAPDLILWASLIEAQIDIHQDDRIPLWQAKYDEAKQAVIRQDKHEEFSGSPLAVTAR